MIRFVTGTGPGVGKTVACAALARLDAQSRYRASYFKAVQTGVEPGATGDADWVGSAAQIPALEGQRFSGRLDPAIAAEESRAHVSVDWLVDRARLQASGCDVLYVESTGGLLTPLSDSLTMADYAIRLGGELLIVTRPAPGALNDAALTLEAARSRSLHVLGFVLNRWPPTPGVLERTMLVHLQRRAPVLGVIPVHDGLDTRILEPLPPDVTLQPCPSSFE
ncbi:MAG: dethiobiotin synthase [Acidimicrobiia bacterium]